MESRRERRSSDISENVLYPKYTKYLRIVEMILCGLCLSLSFYFWSTGNTLLGAVVVLFATSFGFLVITSMDVVASSRRRQYSAPVWAGLAFLAAFMFFLSFGFMILQGLVSSILIGIAFALTGIVFLIDGIYIIMNFFQLQLPKKVHPISSEKESREKATQVESDLEIIEELPISVKKVAPKFAAARELRGNTSSSPRSSFPITSYGGTFPVGEIDAPPLPTPDNLTGIEPAIPAQLYVPRRNTRENSPETRSVSSEVTSPRHLSVEENIYPSIREESAPEGSTPSTDHGTYMPSERKISQPIQSTSISSGPTYTQQNDEPFPPAYNRASEVVPPARFNLQNLEQTPPLYNRQNEGPHPSEDVMSQAIRVPPQTFYHQGNIEAPIISPHQAAGEPQPPVSTTPRSSLNARYPHEVQPENPQVCQCCATRARDQVTPFVTHHYNQTPCICGYTHYQASTVVKGAVKQCPRDTVQQQQRMIKDQLDQMRDSNMYHGCSCHDEPAKETNVPYMHLVRDSPILEDAKDSNSLNSLENDFVIIGVKSREEGSNATVDISRLSISDALGNNIPRRSNSPTPREDDRRKVTIGTLDFISSSIGSQSSNISKNRRPENQKYQSPRPQENQEEVNSGNQPRSSTSTHDSRIVEDRHSENLQPSTADNFESGQSSDARDKNEAIFRRRFRELNRPEDLSKLTMLSQDLDGSSPSLDRAKQLESNNAIKNRNLESASPEHDIQYTRRKSSKLGNREILDSHEYVLKKISTSTNGSVATTSRDNIDRYHLLGAERPFYRDEEKTWTTDAQKSRTTSTASLSPERNLVVCRAVPPKCQCCPNMINQNEKTPTKISRRKEERRSNGNQKDRRKYVDKTFVECRNPSVPAKDDFRRSSIRDNDIRYPQKSISDYRQTPINDRSLEGFIDRRISNTPVTLPRSLDPIEEHRLRQGINLSDSEERISHLPPFYEGFPEEMVMMKQMTCKCTCICHPQKIPKDILKKPKKPTATIPRRHDNARLDQKPYHPKDEFKLLVNPFTDISQKTNNFDCICEEPTKIIDMQKLSSPSILHEDDHQPLRTPQPEPTVLKTRLLRSSVKCLEECADCSTKRKKPEPECLEECSSCPIRSARLAREAKLREELDAEERARYFQRKS